MGREPQIKDRYQTVEGPGEVVARAETPPRWLVRVKLDAGGYWQGFDRDLGELLEAAGEKEVLSET